MEDYDRFAYSKLGCPWRHDDGGCVALRNSGYRDTDCKIQNCAFVHWAKALKGEELPTLPPRKEDSAEERNQSAYEKMVAKVFAADKRLQRKYNVYDKVWVVLHNRVQERCVRTVEEIAIGDKDGQRTLPSCGRPMTDAPTYAGKSFLYKYTLFDHSASNGDAIRFRDDDLFPTKQALLESL